jgi:SPASM domain peptide maturase of grasp-with-spasm system
MHAECLPVKGFSRSVICDLNRKKLYPITNDLFDILSTNEGENKLDIFSQFDEEDWQILTEYFDYLEELECIHWVHPELYNSFPKLNLDWEYPSSVTNAIVDVNEVQLAKFYEIIKQLDIVQCKNIQIRNFKALNLELILSTIIESVNVSNFRAIDLITPYTVNATDVINKINIQRLSSIIFYSAPYDSIPDKEENKAQLAFIKQNVINEISCGQIHHNYFNTNITLFTESQKHNTCLNRKISIDVNGEIKNCPSMAKSYGNIKDTTLAEAIEKPGFKDMWFINKDQIAVCKDCEFRYICTDCRAYIENPEDIYSKPLKCGYNPYTAEWEEWSTNPLKQKAIEYYGMQELVKK